MILPLFHSVPLVRQELIQSSRVCLRCFRDPIQVPRIKNDHRVCRIRENRVPDIKEIRSLQVHTGYLTVSFSRFSIRSCSQGQCQGHFIIIQPKFLKFGTTWFRFSFLFTYVCSYKFLGKLTPIFPKLIERFLIYHCFCIVTTRWHSH